MPRQKSDIDIAMGVIVKWYSRLTHKYEIGRQKYDLSKVTEPSCVILLDAIIAPGELKAEGK